MNRQKLTAACGAVVFGACVGFGIPLGELWLDCRVPHSEDCVWGKSLLSFSLIAGAILAAIIATVSFLIVRAWQRRSPQVQETRE